MTTEAARAPYEERWGPSGPHGASPSRVRRVLDRVPQLVIGAVVAASFLLAVASGNPLLGAVPVIAAAVVFALWKLPLRMTVLAYLFVALTVFAPPKNSDNVVLGSGPVWSYMLQPVGTFLAANLNKLTGIAALRFSGAELLYVFMLVLILLRSRRAIALDGVGRRPGADVMYLSGAIALGAVILLELWGLARGGDFQQSLWQFRQLLWLPVLTWIFSYCVRGVDDLSRWAVVVSAAACTKVALGYYFLRHDVWPTGWVPESMTGHDDSVLYVAVFFFWIARLIHVERPRHAPTAVAVCTWMMVGLVLNNRRIAFVSLVASLFVLYTMLHGRVKLWATRVGILLLPLACLYLVAARTHTTGIFKPGAQLMSVSEQTDGSSRTRDIENYNLIQTIKPSPIVGSGWGHEYREMNRAYNISQVFAQYRYIAHNSILWLLSIGGVAGFALIWMQLVVGVFLATRSYRFARDAHERTAAASMIAIMICYVVQAWGDMGTQGGAPTLLLAGALAGAGKLARATGAWPGRVRISARSPSAS